GSWGEAEPGQGTIPLQRPAMDRAFTGTRSAADVLLAVAKKDAATGAKFPQADYRAWLFARLPGGNNAQTMSAALAKGMMVGAAGTPKVSRSTGASTARAVAALPPVARPTTALSAPSSGEFFLVTYPSPTLGDGRGANKPWLQE